MKLPQKIERHTEAVGHPYYLEDVVRFCNSLRDYLEEREQIYNRYNTGKTIPEPTEPVEGWEKDFDEKFARINHFHRGECVITDVTGSKFEAHTENGVVTEVGGLKSIKDFIRTLLTSAVAEREREIITWAKNNKRVLWHDDENRHLENVQNNNTLDELICYLSA
jgi:hypothetical protein